MTEGCNFVSFARLRGTILFIGLALLILTNLASIPRFSKDYFISSESVERIQEAIDDLNRNSTRNAFVSVENPMEYTVLPTHETTPTILDDSILSNILSGDGPFTHNSLMWLNGSHLSNTIEDSDFIWSQISEIDLNLSNSNALHSLMDRTICHKDGRFRSLSKANWNASDDKLINDWAFRLTYFAIHSWHHAPARREALARRQYRGNLQDLPFQIKSFDFECPDAKFLITNMERMGMGVSFRLGAVNSMLTAIATGRITLFLNSVKSSKVPYKLAQDLWLASCDRLDMQCAFLPTSPCVLTREILENECIEIPEGDSRRIRRSGDIHNSTIAAHRYVFMQTRLNPIPDRGLHHKVRSTLFDEADGIVAAFRRKTNGFPTEVFLVLDRALQQLKNTPPDTMQSGNFTYNNRHSLIHHAALQYILRLQRNMKERVEGLVWKILNESKNFNPELAIGLPIRASDKCYRESTCFSFDTYMSLANEIWLEHFPANSKGSLIITSEASSIANSSRTYAASPAGLEGNLSIIMNLNDILQDTGRPRSPIYRSQADAVMESTLVAMSLQMHAKFTIGNCCSNFHAMLFDLLHHGCGLSDMQQCLQETQNPAYHACCHWTKADECIALPQNQSSS